MRLIFIILTLFLVSACQKPSTKIRTQAPQGGDAHEPSPPPPLPEKLYVLKTDVVAHPEPNHYSVKLHWHEGTAVTDSWLITREDADTVSTVAAVGEEVREVMDEKVTAGRTYRYLLWLDRQGGSLLHASALVKIPIDKEITGEVALSEIKGVHRLFLRKGSRLRAADGSLRIEAHEIYSDEGVIESFPEFAMAKAETGGRDGGLITLRAQLGHGILRLVARGEHGGKGANGADGAKGRDGEKGSDGVANNLIIPGRYIHDMRYARIRFIETQMDADRFLAELTGHYPACDLNWRMYFRCSQSAGHGRPGEKGAAGEKGQDGFAGGAASPFYVAIAQAKDLKLRLSFEPGKGGPGGAGGRGGAGGVGGRTGNRDEHCVCAHEERPRQNGEGGKNGDGGGTGPEGKVSPYCLDLNGVEQGDCAAFEERRLFNLLLE